MMRTTKNHLFMRVALSIMITLALLTLVNSRFTSVYPARVHAHPPVFQSVGGTNITYVDPDNVTDFALTPEATSPLTLRPDGDGTFTDWTGSYADWDDADPHDGDGSYVSATSDALSESSTLEDHTAETWSIAKVMVTIYARTNIVSNDVVIPTLVIGGVEYDGKSHTLTNETYTKCTSEWAINPDTDAFWTWSNIDNLEAGVYSDVGRDWTWDDGLEMRVTQLYVEVSGPRLAVDIEVDDVTDLWLYQFELTFNPDVLQGVWYSPEAPVEIGSFIGSAGGTVKENAGAGWNNTLGKLRLTGAYLTETDPAKCPDGGGVLSPVVFEVIAKGESKVRLGEETALQDPTGTWISYGREHVKDGYFRNVALDLIPTADFTTAPVGGMPDPLEGYDVKFTSTSTGGTTPYTYKWYFWRFVHRELFEFPTTLLKPDGDGTYTDWTGDYTQWDELTIAITGEIFSDGDATYVSATAGGLYESSTLESHTNQNCTIDKVRVTICARANTTTDDKVKLMLVIGGTKYEGSAYSLDKTYAMYTSEWSTNPATGSAWTWSAVDALEAGVKSEAVAAWTGEIRVTQLFVEVIPAPAIFTTDSPTLVANYTWRGTWNVTLTVTDDNDVVGTKWGYLAIKAHDIFFNEIYTNTTIGKYPAKPRADIGQIVEVKAEAINEGNYTETFDVTTFWAASYAGEYRYGDIGTQTGITLAAGASQNVTFDWDTAGCNLTHPEVFAVHANASAVQYEYDKERDETKIADNEFTGPGIRIRLHDTAVTDIDVYNYLLIKPVGDGTYTDWTGTYLDWDDQPDHDGDATYVSAAAEDLYHSSTLQDHTTEAWIIEKVKVSVVARSNKTPAEAVHLILVVGGTRYNSTPVMRHDLKSEYEPTPGKKYSSEWLKNPATDSAWTWSDIDALEAGVKSTQAGFTWTPQSEIRVTQLYVEVFGPGESIFPGEIVGVSVTINNEGDFNRTDTSVTAYYDETAIDTKTISLMTNKSFSDAEYVEKKKAANNTITLTFNWNTTGVTVGNYTISAEASAVPEEPDKADNVKADGIVWVKGDVTPPVISTPVHEPEIPDPGEAVTVSVNVTDPGSGVHEVILQYSTDNATWTNVTMVLTDGDTYTGTIEGFSECTYVSYKIVATDNDGNPATEDNGGAYYVYHVIPEFATWLSLFIALLLATTFMIFAKRKLMSKNLS